jgi:hypothetical protein
MEAHPFQIPSQLRQCVHSMPLALLHSLSPRHRLFLQWRRGPDASTGVHVINKTRIKYAAGVSFSAAIAVHVMHSHTAMLPPSETEVNHTVC